jgi:CRP-like cAMP-binding protein
MDKTIKQVLKLLQTPETSSMELHDLLMSIAIFNRLFRNFSYMTRLSLISNITTSEYQQSETIFHYGDFFDKILVLVQGSILQYSAHNEFYLEPVKLINDPFTTRSRLHPNNAIAKEPCVILKLSLDVYHEVTLDELETNVKEKIKYVELLIPGISACTNAQKEKIAYLMDTFTYPKGSVICHEGNNSDKLQIVLEGECAIVKLNGGRARTISKLCKGSFVSENSVFYGRPTEYTVIVSSEKAKIGKFKNSDIKNNFPSHILSGIRNMHGIKEQMHDKILRFPKLVASLSVPAKNFPLASPKTLNKIALFNFRQSFGSSPTDIKPKFKSELERLRDSSPLRINKFY